MSLAVTSVVVSVASVAYSYYNYTVAKRKQEKAKREAEKKADLAKGIQIPEEGQASALSVLFGRGKAGGVRVHFHVSADHRFAAPAESGLAFQSFTRTESTRLVWRVNNTNANWTGSWFVTASSEAEFNSNPGWVLTKDAPNSWKIPDRTFDDSVHYVAPKYDFLYCPFKFGSNVVDRPPINLSFLQGTGFSFPDVVGDSATLSTDIYGSKNEFYFIQQAITCGELSAVYSIDVDNKPYTFEGYAYGQRFHIYPKGSVADPWMTINDASRANARFSKVAYLTACFRLNRDDPQYSGTPNVQLYAEGNPVRDILFEGGIYHFSDYKINSNNAALVLAEYLTNKDIGKGLPDSNIDLKSFYKAKKICAIKVLSNVAKAGSIWTHKGGNRDIYLYEANLFLSTSTSHRNNIQKILDTMGLATLVWAENKYKLNLPYAELYNPSKTYEVDSVIQFYKDGRERLYRANSVILGSNPNETSQWVEDVIPGKLKVINDDMLMLKKDLEITWPSADTKLNFVTARFLDEDQDFVENTVSWPEKNPTDPSDIVYATYMTEDNNVPLDAEFFEEGCTTIYHAKARAEQRVRASRGTIVYSFSADAVSFQLEPGDIFGIESIFYNIPYTLLKVDEINTEEGGIVKVTSSTFDAGMLAWNVPDNVAGTLKNIYEGYAISQASDLSVSIGESSVKTSNYKLRWTRSVDNRVNRYRIRYTTDSISSISKSTPWTELGETGSNEFELPPLNGTFTFTVVAVGNGREAPFLNLTGGSGWPFININLSAAFLENFGSVSVNLSNDSHVILTDAMGVVGSYAGSGTDIECFVASTRLVYDGIGVTPGTFKVVANPEDCLNITHGAITNSPSSPYMCRVADQSGITANEAEITYTVSGTTPSGSTFVVRKKQVFAKAIAAAGQDADYVFIKTSASVMTKQSPNTTIDGAHSVITIQGRRVYGSTISDYGYVTVTADTETEAATAVPSITTAYANNAGISNIVVKLYDTAEKTTLLDTEEIPVVFRGATGDGALSAILSNKTHAIPCDSSGTPLDYSNTNTNLYVFEGSERLVYSGANTAGTWQVSISGSNIAASNVITDNYDFIEIGDHDSMTAETAAITYTVYGKTLAGAPFEITTVQTFVKARRGESPVTTRLSNRTYTFVTDSSGTINTYSGTGNTVSVFQGTNKLEYDGIGTANGKWKVTAVGVNISPSAVVTKSGLDAVYGVASNMEADGGTITYTITGKSNTGTPFTLTETQTFAKQKQGLTGRKSATVFLYQWSPTPPTNPTGASVVTWSPVSNTEYTKAPGATDGWSTNIPANPGTPSIRLWTVSKLISDEYNATNTPVDWTSGTSPVALTQNGKAGINTATVTLYKYAISIPSAPVGVNTFTWASNTFDEVSGFNTSNGWFKEPTGGSQGMTLWAADVRLLDSAANNTTVIDWTFCTIKAVGYIAIDGDRGTWGPSYRTAFAVCAIPVPNAESIQTFGAASVPPNDSWGLTGTVWSLSTPTPAPGQYLWKTDGIYNPETGYTTWETPYWSSLKVGNLSAISANMGTLNAGKIASTDGNFIIDLDNKFISISV